MGGDPPVVATCVFNAARAIAIKLVGRLLQRRGASFERRAVSGVRVMDNRDKSSPASDSTFRTLRPT